MNLTWWRITTDRSFVGDNTNKGNEAPNDKPPVRFRLISSANNIFIFENKAHNFPQRINYQNRSGGELLAWIEGTVNGEFKKVDFSCRRETKN